MIFIIFNRRGDYDPGEEKICLQITIGFVSM